MSRLTGNEAKSLMEAYNAVYVSKEEEVVQESTEELNEAPMTAFQAAGGNARLAQLNRGRSPRSGRVTAAELERKGQDILYKAGGGDAAIAKGPTRTQNVRGGGQVQVPTLTRQDIINRGTVAAKPGSTPVATAPKVAPAPVATAPKVSPAPVATAPKPSITSSLDDLKKMQQASQIRQQAGAPTVTSDMLGSKSSTAPTTPRPQLSARAQALRAGGPAGGARERMLNQSFDMFDAILEHLVAEGYADTNKAALAIMANMSEEWKQSILSEDPVQDYRDMRRASENKGGARGPELSHGSDTKAKPTPPTASSTGQIKPTNTNRPNSSVSSPGYDTRRIGGYDLRRLSN